MTRRADLIKALASMVADVQRLAPAGSGPAAARLISRLTAYEQAHRAALESVLRGEQPDWSFLTELEIMDRDEAPVERLLAEFGASRQRTLDLLERMTPGDWQRKTHSPLRGETSLRFLVHDWVAHDTEVLGQLLALRVGERPAGSRSALALDTEAETGEQRHERARVRKWSRGRPGRGN